MHYIDANKMAEKKAWQQLHKNVAGTIEPTLEATPHKAAAVRPHTAIIKLDEPDMQVTAGEVEKGS